MTANDIYLNPLANGLLKKFDPLFTKGCCNDLQNSYNSPTKLVTL